MTDNIERIEQGFALGRRARDLAADPTAPYPEDAASTDRGTVLMFLIGHYGYARRTGSSLGISAGDWYRRIDREISDLCALREIEADKARSLRSLAQAADDATNPALESNQR